MSGSISAVCAKPASAFLNEPVSRTPASIVTRTLMRRVVAPSGRRVFPTPLERIQTTPFRQKLDRLQGLPVPFPLRAVAAHRAFDGLLAAFLEFVGFESVQGVDRLGKLEVFGRGPRGGFDRRRLVARAGRFRARRATERPRPLPGHAKRIERGPRRAEDLATGAPPLSLPAADRADSHVSRRRRLMGREQSLAAARVRDHAPHEGVAVGPLHARRIAGPGGRV